MKKLKAGLLALMALATSLGAACGTLLAPMEGVSEALESSESSVAASSSVDEISSSLEEGTSVEEENSASDESSESSSSEDSSVDEKDEEEEITIAKALEICGGLHEGDVTTERYLIRAVIESVTNSSYGAMLIKDDTGSISVYRADNADGSLNYSEMEEKPYKGDEVLLSCTLQNYGGSYEIKNARIVEFKSNAGNINEEDYSEMTIADARSAAEGALVKVKGVVAQITYANGMKPNGLMLIDDTQSIYVFDGDLAARVQEGNEITILATKTYWVLEKEQANAEKHGYGGCNQLTDTFLVSNDEGNNEYSKAAIQESTVKEIVETPVTEDCTTIVYKVNALVSKQPGNGFTNYYFYDIDGETGAYTYTQANGNDFAWIDEFDGKICTVYLTALNAKSEASACFYRLLPVEIIDEGYQFDVKDAAKFAVDYYGADQFLSNYTADPALELKTTVSSELLGFENATLTYTSSDEDVISFEVVEETTVMHCNNYGDATVTVTGTYGENTYEEEIYITFTQPVSYESITVAEAIETAPDTEITVKGIVGPSVVNKDGFYLFGEDGSMIAVLVNDVATFEELSIGNEVILKGMRERYVKDDASAIAGQTCIVKAELLVNYYGKHEYSTEKFVTGKTVSEFYDLDKTVDYSTTVFVLTGTFIVKVNAYNSTVHLSDGNKEIRFYCSGKGQYAFLLPYENQEITVEVAACNWNDKNYWTGCVLAIRTADGKTFNTLHFD